MIQKVLFLTKYVTTMSLLLLNVAILFLLAFRLSQFLQKIRGCIILQSRQKKGMNKTQQTLGHCQG